MADLIKMDYAAAETASAQMRTARNDIQTQLQDFTATTDAMVSQMSGETQLAYEQAKQQARQSFEGLATNVEEVARLLDQHALQVRETDAAGARRIGSI